MLMFICEKCGKEHDGSFGSGRFCSRSCANSRSHSEETRRLISLGVLKGREPVQKKKKTPSKRRISPELLVCPLCGNKKGAYSKLCNNCRSARVKLFRNEKLLSDFVKLERPPAIRYNKIRGFARAELEDIDSCEICGFKLALCVHHIEEISQFPLDTPLKIVNSRSNLIKICPNHHAMVHAGLISKDFLKEIAHRH